MLVPVLPLPPLWHMGALHPYEQLLTVLLAFGPFAVLGLVIWRRRREDDAAVSEEVTPEVSSSRTTEQDQRRLS